jgi:tetratricopeptide (TPR) repeat protein
MPFNPVEQRLLDLAGHWETFQADPAKRLLIWQADENALRFYQCFFEVQKYATDYTVGSLFIVFDTPFQNVIQYSRALKESLAGQYEASLEDLKQQGISPDWHFNQEEVPHSATGFVKSLLSFGSCHHEKIAHLVAVFMPRQVADNAAFSAWLSRILAKQIPERLRFVVIDPLNTPRLSSLIESGDQQILVDSPKIDALSTAQETFAQEKTVGPAGVFRNLLIGLMTLVEKGTSKQVKLKADDALKFARKQNWADQEFVVTMLVAGSLLKEKRLDEAVKNYQSARKAAEKAITDGHPSGKELVLQSWFGQAAAHLAASEFEKAVECYDEAAILAQQIPNLILGIEAFRMACFCFNRMKEPEAALDRGQKALTVGARLKTEARNMTTMPIAALDLLKAIDPDRVLLMEDIKYLQNAKIDQARIEAEQRAISLEQTNDPQPFRDIETHFELETQQAKQAASQQLESCVADANTSFKQAVYHANELLGDSWLLNTLMATPLEKSAAGANAP